MKKVSKKEKNVPESYQSLATTDHAHANRKKKTMSNDDIKDSPTIAESRFSFDLDMDWKHAVLGILMYLIVGIFAFSVVFEKWDYSDSLYFSIVTFTTIGYGDMTPSTKGGEIFTCFFALFGVMFVAVCLGTLCSQLIESEVQAFEKTRENISTALLAADDEVRKERKSKSYGKKSMALSWLPFALAAFTALSIIIGGAYYIGSKEGWTWSECLYFAVITSTTIGFGDYTPEQGTDRLFACFYILFAVGTITFFFGSVIDMITHFKRQKFMSHFHSKQLHWNDLQIMDNNMDGQVDKGEYVEYMLTSLNFVDPSLIEELHDRFDALDIDNDGFLTTEDVIRKSHSMVKLAGDEFA